MAKSASPSPSKLSLGKKSTTSPRTPNAIAPTFRCEYVSSPAASPMVKSPTGMSARFTTDESPDGMCCIPQKRLP